MRQEAFYLPSPRGRLFGVLRAPATGVRGAIVHLPAFGDEMNKSRSVVAHASRTLADAGWAVLQLDPLGCGDSEGDFADATWETWLRDAELGAGWMRERFPGPQWLWGLRTGALLASACAQAEGAATGLLCWQPIQSGKAFLHQFLRLRMMSGLIGKSGARADTQALRQKLREGEALEVAGYVLSPAMAAGLEQAELLPPPRPVAVVWLEVSGEAQPELSPAAGTKVARWRELGLRVEAAATTGPPFWNTVEVEECPQLVLATLDLLERVL